MRLTEIDYESGRPVEGYGPGFFRIGSKAIMGPVCVLPGQGAESWAGLEDLDRLISAAGQIDVLLIGTGAEIAHIPAAARTALEDAGIGVEVMASPAACRSYNVLLSEGRRIGLAVLPV